MLVQASQWPIVTLKHERYLDLVVLAGVSGVCTFVKKQADRACVYLM